MMLPLLDPVESGAFEGASAASVTSDQLVVNELWISLVSLLRSHLGALQTTGKLSQAVYSSISDSEVQIADLSRTLRLSLQVSSGDGEWSLDRMGQMIAAGVWLLQPDATVTIDGAAPQDMELAVEAFAAKLWARKPIPDTRAPERTAE